MAYTGLTKQQLAAAVAAKVQTLGYPDNTVLTKDQIEDILFTAYEEGCKVIDPDKDYPDVRP